MGPGIKVLAAGALTATAQIVNGRMPSPRLIAGVGITGLVLVSIAGKSPEIAGAFGTLILLTALMVSGYDVAKAAGNVLKVGTPS
jgi:hypothetical protein